MKNKKVKSIISIVALVCFVLNMFTMLSFAAENNAKVFVTISNQGELVCVHEKVLVTDVDKDGALTINDALIITHRDLYKGSGTGYETETTQWGLGIKKLWGVQNGGSYGYYVNNNSAWNLSDTLENGDYLYAFVYKDTQYYSDNFSYFTLNTVEEGSDAFVFYMMKGGYAYNAETDDWDFVLVPAVGAIITIDGVDSEYVTDSEGSVTMSVNDDKYHIISARVEGEIITPPVITVNGSRDGWYYEYGNYYYFENGEKYTGFKNFDGKFYYFGNDGRMVKGLKSITNKKGNTYKYFFGSDGVMYTGWKKVVKNDKTYYYYFFDNGVMATGWQKLERGNGKTYLHYFGDNGIMRTGWQKIKRANGKTYLHYFGTNGIMRTGWQSIKNSKGVAYKYYFGTNGCMVTGWQNITASNGKTYKYYFGDNGYMRTGWQSIKNSKGIAYKYYFGDNGVMRTGWQNITASNGKTYKYYFGDNGYMRTGWQKIGSKKYYFGANGVMRTGWQKIDGKKYYFDYDGVYITDAQIKAYVKAYKQMLAYAKLGQYNSSSQRYIYAFDTLSFGTGKKLCCLEYDKASDELYASYIMDNGDYQSRNAVLIQKKVTNKMEITFAYKITKNGKTTDLNGAVATTSKRAYTKDTAITCSKGTGTKYTTKDYSQLMTSQTAHIMKELSKYLAKDNKVELSSLLYKSYK